MGVEEVSIGEHAAERERHTLWRKEMKKVVLASLAGPRQEWHITGPPGRWKIPPGSMTAHGFNELLPEWGSSGRPVACAPRRHSWQRARKVMEK